MHAHKEHGLVIPELERANEADRKRRRDKGVNG